VANEKLNEKQLRAEYPHTYDYLRKHSVALKERSSVRSGGVPWWCPHRPAPIGKMLQTKIVSPHLVLLPRFSLDAQGRYAVSHSPWFTAKEDASQEDLLRYFVAVLNSTVVHWQLATTSHRYSRGYVMLEKKTLSGLRVPDPSELQPTLLNRILRMVNQRLQNIQATEIEKEIDRLVADAYGLTPPERQEIGLDN